MVAAPLTSSYVCDTLPAARLASTSTPSNSPPLSDHSPSPRVSVFDLASDLDADKMEEVVEVTEDHQTAPASQPPPRKLCVRHQRMADEGTNLKLQQVSYFLHIGRVYSWLDASEKTCVDCCRYRLKRLRY